MVRDISKISGSTHLYLAGLASHILWCNLPYGSTANQLELDGLATKIRKMPQ